MTKRTLGLCAVLAWVGVVAFVAGPVRAQGPVGGALATLAAATAQADQWQRVQRQAQATRQAELVQATVNAGATRQAMEIEATRQALDDLARQHGATATAEAVAIGVTRQAVSAAQAAQATLDSQRVTATAAGYELAYQQSREQADLGRSLLYLAAAMALIGTGWVILAWVRRLAGGGKPVAQGQAPVCLGDVIDITPVGLPLLPAGQAEMPGVRIVNDPRIIEAIGEWFHSEDNDDE